MPPPVVSIIMSMRNASASIGLTLQSLIDQTFPDWELLLLDDGSGDDSVGVAKRFRDERITLLCDGRHLGLATRMNEAVAASRGRYIARMDADDIAYPERMARQVAYLENHPEIDLLGTRAIIFDNAGKVVGQLPSGTTHQEIAARPWRGFYLAHPTWMGRRTWFMKFPYDACLPRAQDYDLLLRSHATSRFACLPDILLGYRQEHLSLAKSLATRKQVVQSAMNFGKSHGNRMRPLLVMMQQFVKAGADALAILTGLQYRLLRHRALPVGIEDREVWRHIWLRLNSESNTRCAE